MTKCAPNGAPEALTQPLRLHHPLGRRARLDRRVAMTVARGAVVLVELDRHEQRGVRPWMCVSDPAVNAGQRYPLVAVVPVTGPPDRERSIPRCPLDRAASRSRHARSSTGCVRSIDKRRIRGVFGEVTADELAAIDRGLLLYLGLSAELSTRSRHR